MVARSQRLGTAQGSILGPFVLNVFQNDLVNIMSNASDIYNYADDNTIGCLSDDIPPRRLENC